ncbi:MAG: helix-turn-helix transcriptional regulator, partial [Prevotellaceae bacterium]|nr:helix-turn-helix transcriptional regulator [Prevotellaceae bacterium]
QHMDTKAIGNRLKELRGSRSQSEVANALDISISALSMYENGERIPRDDVKIRISNYYKKPIHKIFFV